jgi:hypothetical protein
MKTEKQQTAVEWYAEEAMRLEIKKTKGNISVYQMLNELSNVLNQAKEMEKEQIEDAYQRGRFNGQANWGYGNDVTAEKYYNETFKPE